MFDDSRLLKNAQAYCHDNGIGLLEEAKLGHGTDGSVWVTSRGTAVKASGREWTHFAEVASYVRLAERGYGFRKLAGFAIPRLLAHDDALLVIEMSIVQPPYLLDFGKTYLDFPPSYFDDPEMVQQFREEYRELFEDRWPEIEGLLGLLESMGIYYVDPKPANIRFADL